MARHKTWDDFSSGTKIRITLLGLLQVLLLAAALWDIRQRPAMQIRGGKKLWTSLAFVNTIGPLAYFMFGRKTAGRQLN